MKLDKIEKPFNFIIFGASGDLAKLKLFPSIYELAIQKRFAKNYSIFGYARSDITTEEFRKRFRKSVIDHTDPKILDKKVLDELVSHVHYHKGQYDKASDYKALAESLLKEQGNKKVYNLAYLAVPSKIYGSITEGLAGIRKKIGDDMQLMMEKPFGESRASAGNLFRDITTHFNKRDLFLIDHYLGKAAVQSILPLRYNNTILNLLLKGAQIANIQISALETTGVDERVGFFDSVGIVNDMIQSHLLQLLTLITMRMPMHQEVKSIRREKGDILSALRHDKEQCGIVLGQYKSYKKIKEVSEDSKTPTFAAFRFFIDLTDWYKVPIYIRTGKKLTHKHTYIVVEFKKPPFQAGQEIEANRLIIELYPNEKIQMRLVNDKGQVAQKSQEVISQESLACMGDDCLPAYGRLILDAFLKRYTSFLSIDEILASWHFIDELMECVNKFKVPLQAYEGGSSGPKEQYDLTKIDNYKWYDADRL